VEWIEPDWRAPANVRAACTTRIGGVSSGAYSGLNLADHVGDDPRAVARNRALLRLRLGLPREPVWLRQVHGCSVADLTGGATACEADAAVARRAGEVCAVLTADCLPLLITDRAGTCVAAVHAGWRGLAAGVIEATLARLPAPPASLSCWLGPAIGPRHFEVGAEVRERFLQGGEQDAGAAFKHLGGAKWLADLYLLARQRLSGAGVTEVSGGGFCTYGDRRRFFSYRRDGATGRMASLVWIASGSFSRGVRSAYHSNPTQARDEVSLG
jgi:YfiH family protein